MLTSSTQPYLGALALAGRRVVVVGGGTRAQRRLPGLLGAGAEVVLVAPDVTPAVEHLMSSGDHTWHRRPYRMGDLDGAWLAVVCTRIDDLATTVSRHAARLQTFCLDDTGAQNGSWFPAHSGEHDGLRVGVWAPEGQDRRAAFACTALVDALRDGDVPDVADRPARAGVALVGGGPGDPDLLTVRGRRLLAMADVVITDRLAPRDVLEGLGADVEVIDASKIPYGRALAQREINDLLVARARAGSFVVRLKGGDPFVYGRGYEEVIACSEAGVPVTVVPGITSAIAAPAAAGVPVSHRGVAHEVVVVSAHVPPDCPDSLVNWPALAQMRGTIVLLMAVLNIREVAAALIRHGRTGDTPVAVVQDGTTRIQRTVRATLATVGQEILDREVQPPAVIVVGAVAGLTPDTESWAAAMAGRRGEPTPADESGAEFGR